MNNQSDTTETISLLEMEADHLALEISKAMNMAKPFMPIIMMLRQMDIYHLYGKGLEGRFAPGGLPIEMALQFGWPILLRSAYKKLSMQPEPMFFECGPTDPLWIQNILGQSGVVAFTRRVADLAKHGLIKFIPAHDNEIVYDLTSAEPDLERFDVLDLEYVRANFIEKIIANKWHGLEKEWPKIKKVILETVQNPLGKFISYGSPPKVDEFFEKEARQHIIHLQQHEDFGPTDVFGGLPYKTYVDILETVMAVALRHIGYCSACAVKNPSVNMANLLTYIGQDSIYDSAFLQRFNLNEGQMRQVFSCLTLSAANFEKYTNISGDALPPYIRLSASQTVRSIAGCLHNPFQFLNFELRRRWPTDYFEAVNNREGRFRNDIFQLFKDKGFIKIDREINVTIGKIKTDIDCVLYDRLTGTVGLFQLKWQEPFAHSLRKRRNDSDEFYKANKWVDRIDAWVKENKPSQLLNSLQITAKDSGAIEVGAVLIFVISRHTGHFTNGQPDSRAVWGSWWQMVANMGKIKSTFDDPIKLAYYSFDFMHPSKRRGRNEASVTIQPPVKVGPYHLMQRMQPASS